MTSDPAGNREGGAGFCSLLSAERGLPPIGTAGSYDAILAFELDSPWTPKLAGSRASDVRLDEAIAAIGSRAKTTRLLALEPNEALRRQRGASRTRVLHFSRGQGPFGAYSRREYEVPRESLARLLECLAGVATDSPGALADRVATADAMRDVLVCTHGARDACCGKFGYGFYVEMCAVAAARREPLRIWRTSHLGGHRFAPTLLDLPSGRMFGRLAHADATVVLDGGDALVARLASIYRGRCALPEPAQIVERELWTRTGAAFERSALSWTASDEGAAWHVEVVAGGANFAARVARIEVEAVRTPASCGRDPEAEAPWGIVE
jgi:hypothetical protein